MKSRLMSMVCGALVLYFGACGKDSPAANSGNTAGTGSAGAGGSGSGMGCGATVCKAPKGFTGTLCCRDAFNGQCGEGNSRNECKAFPAQTEPNCPDGTAAEGVDAMLVRGCCVMDTNECGVDLSGIGAYCSKLMEAESFLAAPADGSMYTTFLPPATHCDGTPIN
jgi:hypothetical protein